jgi:hypothetical protein
MNDSNRISTTLSPEDQEIVTAALGTIRGKLSFLINLTATERIALTKLGDKAKAFTERAFEVAEQNSQQLPQGLYEEMRKDTELLAALTPIRVIVDQLQKQIDDTVLQLGAETYAAARTVYAISKTPYAQATMRDVSQDLSKRFGRRRRNGAQPAETDPPAPIAPPPTTTS